MKSSNEHNQNKNSMVSTDKEYVWDPLVRIFH